MTDPSDPRTFLAAERTLLAWNRTCVAIMGFGFVVERFGLFLRIASPISAEPIHHGASYWAGLSLMAFASLLAVLSTVSFHRTVSRLQAADRPMTPLSHLGVLANLGVAMVGAGLTAYLALAAR